MRNKSISHKLNTCPYGCCTSFPHNTKGKRARTRLERRTDKHKAHKHFAKYLERTV